MLLSLGLAVRLFLQMDVLKLLSWLIGALFVPTLAFACGIWTKNRRTFEFLYLMIWYVGPINHFPILNFMDLQSQYQWFIFFLLTIVLYSCAWFGHKRKLGGIWR